MVSLSGKGTLNQAEVINPGSSTPEPTLPVRINSKWDKLLSCRILERIQTKSDSFGQMLITQQLRTNIPSVPFFSFLHTTCLFVGAWTLNIYFSQFLCHILPKIKIKTMSACGVLSTHFTLGVERPSNLYRKNLPKINLPCRHNFS
jgi:hypothetical protein